MATVKSKAIGPLILKALGLGNLSDVLAITIRLDGREPVAITIETNGTPAGEKGFEEFARIIKQYYLVESEEEVGKGGDHGA